MSRFFLRWFINAVALYAAVLFVPGIHSQSANWISILILALIFGLLNAFLRPLLKFLTCPLIILTLGLFTLLINTFLFWLAGGDRNVFEREFLRVLFVFHSQPLTA